MKEIYVVVCGIYADYQILAVCLEKVKAQEIIDKYNHTHGSFDEDYNARLEVYNDGYCYWLDK